MIYFLAIVLLILKGLGYIQIPQISLKNQNIIFKFENDIMNFKSTFWIWIIQNDTKIEIIKKNTFIFHPTLRKY